METTPAEPAFRSVSLCVTHFDDVFRDAPLEPKDGFNAPSSLVQSVSNHTLVATPLQTSAVAEARLERHDCAEQRPGSCAAACGDNRGQNIVIRKGKKRNPQ